MSTLWQDLRYGFRLLFKNPGFSAIAILTLALGIGANSAIFSVVNTVLLRPLPLPNPDRLVYLHEAFLNSGGYGSVSAPNLKDWNDQNTVFENIAAYEYNSFNLQGKDSPNFVAGVAVSANYLDTVGVQPKLGRTFARDEDQPNAAPVVLLSESLWQRSFARDSSIIGKTISLGGQAVTVIGIMPADFAMPSRTTQLWVPLVFTDKQLSNRGNHAFNVIARLKSDATLAQAREQMSAIGHRLEAQYPDQQTGRGVLVDQVQDWIVGSVRSPLYILLGAVGFVLLIACSNVANLLLIRSASRRKEIAIRSALGAGTSRLIRQFLSESLILAIIGGALGLLLAKLGTNLLVKLGSGILPRTGEIGMDWYAFGFTGLLSLVTGIGFGLVPAFQAVRLDVQGALKQSGKSTTGGPRHNKFRSLLVVMEIALSLILLIGAGLMIKSFVRLQGVDPGFSSENLLTFRVSLPSTKYPNPIVAATFYKSALERISALPGVKTAAVVNLLPIQQSGFNGDFEIVGHEPFPSGRAPWAEYRAASADYFKTMGIPLVSGRYFTDQDRKDSQLVFIINQIFAKKFWPDGDAVGHQIGLGGPPGTIVGVVRDVKQSGLANAARYEIFMPYGQVDYYPMSQSMSFVVRTEIDSMNLVSAVRKEVLSVDSMQPIYNVQTMETVVADSFSDTRVYMLLLGIFAAVAMILAIVGIYGVIAYSVSQRTQEIGIRVALGAQRGDVLRLVVGHGAKLAVIGLVVGLAGAYGLTRLMATLLFSVSATDPATFGGVALLLGFVAILASYIPARRATKVDPMVALQFE